MTTVDVDISSLPADSQRKSIGRVWGLATETEFNTYKWVTYRNCSDMMTALQIGLLALLLLLLSLLLLNSETFGNFRRAAVQDYGTGVAAIFDWGAGPILLCRLSSSILNLIFLPQIGKVRCRLLPATLWKLSSRPTVCVAVAVYVSYTVLSFHPW